MRRNGQRQFWRREVVGWSENGFPWLGFIYCADAILFSHGLPALLFLHL